MFCSFSHISHLLSKFLINNGIQKSPPFGGLVHGAKKIPPLSGVVLSANQTQLAAPLAQGKELL
jgi:hypothetical protein